MSPESNEHAELPRPARHSVRAGRLQLIMGCRLSGRLTTGCLLSGPLSASAVCS